MAMDASGIDVLCVEAQGGTLLYRAHVAEQSLQRDQPDRNDIIDILCYDTARVIEPYPDDERGKSCLIWGTNQNGRIGHILRGYPPNLWVITTYWPDLQPQKWTDGGYTIRRNQ